jgi:hypothetical protein
MRQFRRRACTLRLHLGGRYILVTGSEVVFYPAKLGLQRLNLMLDAIEA